jgi:hypothetical protein
MDTTLHQQREPAIKLGERQNNNTDEVVESAVEIVPEFRELQIEPPQPPLRMTLNPPLEYDGQQYKELIFDFDSMNGKDFIRAEREFTRTYKADKDEMVLPEMKHQYHAIIAAHRANVPVGVILKLPRRYYTPLRVEVLKACGSSPDEDKA